MNRSGEEGYRLLMESGLYDELVREGLLVRHEETPPESWPERDLHLPGDAVKLLKPELLPFVSYPYEWSFSQLKDGAFATLDVQRRALERGMTLKDTSAYNIQFSRGRPIFIDTLSFRRYREGEPWMPYRQFCQHFLAPLALMSCTDVRLGALLRAHLDGVPLDLASALLPLRTWFSFGLLAHIHLHAGSQKVFSGRRSGLRNRSFTRQGLLALLDSLEGAVRSLSWRPGRTQWANYYDETNYSSVAFEGKRTLVEELVRAVRPDRVWDLGANTGIFSRIAAAAGAFTVAFDCDPGAVELNYLECRRSREERLLPLLLDLANPSPATGWRNEERMSLLSRGPADLVMALALVHHLAIGNNLPLPMIADFFSGLCTSLIIEFVPREDSQVQRMLASREDIFTSFTREEFEAAFSNFFSIERSAEIPESGRTLYLMMRR